MKKTNKSGKDFVIFKPISGDTKKVNLYQETIKAGFPSPAEGLIDGQLDLNDLVIKHPAATFFVRVNGDSMEGCGINSGDILVVDRALIVKNRDIVVAIVNGEFTVKRYINKNGEIYLHPENSKYSDIKITDTSEFSVWGVVTFVVHKFD